jgi:hypothetical protein
MLLINLPIKSDVPLVAPAKYCCNCGSEKNVKAEQTDLRRMPLTGLAGAEIKVSLPFPYCELCTKTASRRRPAVIGILVISALISMLLGMAWLFVGPQTSEEAITHVVAPAIVAISLALVLSFYALKRPSGRQTSYFQPVKLINTGHNWPADITDLELGFTNKQYADSFSQANAAAISLGKLKVSKA